MASDRLKLALAQIVSARDYLQTLLGDFSAAEMFVVPPGCNSHLAWQIGHLAMAQYGLCLFRIRGRAELDLELMPSYFRKQFSRGSVPNPDPAANPSSELIREVFDRVYQQVLTELPTIEDSSLDDAVESPYAATATKLGSLLFSAHHEMLHAGQIGMLRRLLGKSPVR
ncbi:MAG: DinB family protein [Planctomycetota bacterium]